MVCTFIIIIVYVEVLNKIYDCRINNSFLVIKSKFLYFFKATIYNKGKSFSEIEFVTNLKQSVYTKRTSAMSYDLKLFVSRLFTDLQHQCLACFSLVACAE